MSRKRGFSPSGTKTEQGGNPKRNRGEAGLRRKDSFLVLNREGFSRKGEGRTPSSLPLKKMRKWLKKHAFQDTVLSCHIPFNASSGTAASVHPLCPVVNEAIRF